MKINKRIFLKSVLIAIALSAILLAIGFNIFPGTWFSTALLYPGIGLGTIIGPAIPDRIIYWLVPEGGGPAFMLIAVLSAILFWIILFTALYYFWQGRRLAVVKQIGQE